jgi:diaminopimelate epimerase
MAKIPFIKMHGTGNDYVYIDAIRNSVNDPVSLAKAMAHRHYGIGGDGLILIKSHPGADGEMEMFNADGSKSEMCGNGLRCVAKYLHDEYARGQDKLKLMTGAGWREASVLERDAKGMAAQIQLDMGTPIWGGLEIPTTLNRPEVLRQTLKAGDREFEFSSVSMGNPHCVIFVDDVGRFPVEAYGPLIENHVLFPRRVNVEFIQKVSRTELIQRTWERGAGETWACGTGAAGVAAICKRLGLTEDKVTIHLTGGDLLMEYTGQGSVKMTGNAVEVFRGEWEA